MSALVKERFRFACAGEVHARRQLAECLEDPRLSGLEERLLFEWHIAHRLAAGWQPGHEFLFIAAAACFDWERDRSRLHRFGRVGDMLNAAIDERDLFRRQPAGLRQLLRDLIRRLRHDGPADDFDVADSSSTLEWLCNHCPHWITIVASTEVVEQWRSRQIVLAERAHEEAAKQRLAEERAPKRWRINGYVWALIMFAAIGGYIKLMTWNAQPRQPYRILSQEQLDEIREQLERTSSAASAAQPNPLNTPR